MTMTTHSNKVLTTQEVADRFHELAQQEKWFEIQEEFFADNVRSIEPDGSPYMSNTQGKVAVRRKAEEFVGKILELHSASTTAPLVTGNHFVVGREKDLTVQGHGRIQIREIMLYEVKDGSIVLEQFFY